jgi:hypothetical protein
MALPHNVGSALQVFIGVKPTDDTGTTINGAAIDRMEQNKTDGFLSCVLHYSVGVETGGTLTTADCKLQHSVDGSTAWSDLAGAAVTQITVDDSAAFVDVDLGPARRFIRAVSTMVTSAGTVPLAATVVAGGAKVKPAL